MMKNLYRGEVFYLIASPLDHVEAYRYFEDGGLAVVDGKIVEAGPFEAMRSRYPDFPVTDYSGKLITPGFIDSHIHFSQSEIQGMYGKQLLDWLDEYTFPAEEAFSSMEYAQDIARFFVKELVKNGTTTCAAYATVHPASVTALFSVATEYNMCILAGKVMMNRNAPDYLMDTTHQGELDCRSLIEDWDGKGRNHYVITPRFAITSTPDQLKSAGRLHARISNDRSTIRHAHRPPDNPHDRDRAIRQIQSLPDSPKDVSVYRYWDIRHVNDRQTLIDPAYWLWRNGA